MEGAAPHPSRLQSGTRRRALRSLYRTRLPISMEVEAQPPLHHRTVNFQNLRALPILRPRLAPKVEEVQLQYRQKPSDVTRPRPLPPPCTDGGGGTTADPPPDNEPTRLAPPPAPAPSPCKPGGGGTILGGLFENQELNVEINPAPLPCTDGGGGTTAAPTPFAEVPLPLPPPMPAPCNEGGGGTTATPGPDSAPAFPECSTEGGGGTTAPPAASPRGPPELARRPCPCRPGGGAITLLAPGPRSVWSPAIPRASTGGARTPACSDPGNPFLCAFTSGGGGATAAVKTTHRGIRACRCRKRNRWHRRISRKIRRSRTFRQFQIRW